MAPGRTHRGTSPARALLVLTAALESACLAQNGAPRDSTSPPVTRPMDTSLRRGDVPVATADPSRTAVPNVLWRGPPPVPVESPTATPSPAEQDPVPPPLPDPRVEIERPYPLYERPRPAGAVAAAVHDERIARDNVGGCSDPGYPSSQPGFHPGTRVIVRTTVANARTPSQGSILAQARRNGYWPFRLCMEEGLRRTPDLGGKAVVDLSLSAGGRVSSARFAKGTLGDEDVERCLVAAARRLSFSPPPARPLRVRLEIDLAPGDAPVLRTGPPEDADLRSPGRVDLLATQQALAGALPALHACYADGLARDFGLWGRLQVLIALDGSGGAAEVTEDESRFPDRQTSACVCEALREVSYPAPRGGAAKLVVGIRMGPASDRPVNEEE